jgi:AbrB family looped-hinge helix DNA binding protein
MSSTTVDDKYRIVIEKKLRKKVKIKPGEKVIVEPVDNTTLKVSVLSDAIGNLEEDPAWKALHKFVSTKRKIPPARLHKFMEEMVWRA